MLNIAEWASGVTVLGPGKRSVVWTQGCIRKCPGCWSPEWQPLTPATLVESEALATILAANSDDCGLTISGGEPMLQAKGLVVLWKAIQSLRPEWNLIVFSGLYREEILLENNEARVNLLRMADCFIGGPYIEALNNGKGLRGSTNKEAYFPSSSRFSEAEMRDIKDGDRLTQWQERQHGVLRIGVPANSIGKETETGAFLHLQHTVPIGK